MTWLRSLESQLSPPIGRRNLTAYLTATRLNARERRWTPLNKSMCSHEHRSGLMLLCNDLHRRREHVCTPMWYSTLILALCTPAPLQLASQDSWTHEQTPQGMVWQRIWQYIALTSTFRRLANSVVHFLVERPQALHNEPMDGLLAWWAMISGRRTTFDHKHDRLIGATSRNEQTSPGRCPGLDPGAASWTS